VYDTGIDFKFGEISGSHSGDYDAMIHPDDEGSKHF
jgi:hypothetical protein